ncbi:hypothetical protein [Streptosporangium saharense]|uniref:hypothetical protein n=1 Tax=Streptosporangium saharense TaxID=1706840 RepID=UPI003439D5CC
MSDVLTLYLPCSVVPIKVTYGYGEHLSPIEVIAMKMIATYDDSYGKVGAEEFVDLIGLGESVCNDLISGLWSRGHVALDFHRGEIRLTDRSRQAAAAGELEKLETGEVRESIAKIMCDQLTGCVLPLGGSNRPAERRFTIPASPDSGSVENAPRADILNALKRSPESLRGRVVLSARLAPVELRRTTGIRYLPLDVRVGIDPDTDRLRFTVLGHHLPERHRRLVAARLAQIADTDPKSSFVQAVRGRTDQLYREPAPLKDRLDQLERNAADAAHAQPGTRVRSHDRLRAAADRIMDEIAMSVAYEIKAEIVRDSDHLQVIKEIVRSAERQLVLASPIVHLRGIQNIADELHDALNSGVQVVMIWGRSHDDEFDPQVIRLLEQLTGGPGHNSMRLLRSTRSSKIKVSLAIADDREAVITSLPFLEGDSRPAVRQRGLQISAPRPGLPCRLVEDLLTWSARVVPEYTLATSMYTRSEDFVGEGTTDPDLETLNQVLGELPHAPSESDDTASGQQAAIWSEAWVNAVRRLRQFVTERPLPTGRLVQDAEHRDLLWGAIRGAHRRVLIATPDLRNAQISPRLAQALKSQLLQGVQVTVAHGLDITDAASELKSLRQEYTKLDLVSKANNARCLVADDEVVIGSFAYLSDPPGMPHGELSVAIRDAALADRLAGGIGRMKAVTTPFEPIRPPSGTQAAVLHSIMREVGANTRPVGEVIRETLRTVPDPWSYADYVRSAPVPSRIARAVVAWTLRNAPAADREAEAWAWLVTGLWQDREFIPAAVLRRAVLSSEFRPRVNLTGVLLNRAAGMVGDALVEAATDDGSAQAERIALIALCSVELLLGSGDHEAYEALTVLDDVPTPWATLASAVRTHYEKVGRPLPLSRILADIARAQDTLTTERLWQDLVVAIEHVQQTKMQFPQTRRAHEALFRQDHTLGTLREAVDTRNVEGVARWLDRPEVDDLGGEFDRVTFERSPGTSLLTGTRRRGYLRRLDEMVAAARALSGDVIPDVAMPEIQSEAHALAVEISSLWNSLGETAGQPDAPEHVLTHALLEELSVIRRWKS